MSFTQFTDGRRCVCVCVCEQWTHRTHAGGLHLSIAHTNFSSISDVHSGVPAIFVMSSTFSSNLTSNDDFSNNFSRELLFFFTFSPPPLSFLTERTTFASTSGWRQYRLENCYSMLRVSEREREGREGGRREWNESTATEGNCEKYKEEKEKREWKTVRKEKREKMRGKAVRKSQKKKLRKKRDEEEERTKRNPRKKINEETNQQWSTTSEFRVVSHYCIYWFFISFSLPLSLFLPQLSFACPVWFSCCLHVYVFRSQCSLCSFYHLSLTSSIGNGIQKFAIYDQC